MASSWPPSLDALKTDLGVDLQEDSRDAQYKQVLDAAVTFVEGVRSGDVGFEGDPDSDLPEPNSDLVLGTLRLAGRWHTRRRSPDLLVAAGEMGSTRVPGFDSDIERLLKIGRFARARFA